jgi:hypothetical protein
MTERQIIEDGIRFARRRCIEPTPRQMRDLVRFWRDFRDEGMSETEAEENALALAFSVIEDPPWRC